MIKSERIKEKTNIIELLGSKHYSEDEIQYLLKGPVLILPGYSTYEYEVFTPETSELQDVFRVNGVECELIKDQRLKRPPVMHPTMGEDIILPTLVFIGQQIAPLCNGIVANYIYEKYLRPKLEGKKKEAEDYVIYEYLEFDGSAKMLRHLKIKGSAREVVEALKTEAHIKEARRRGTKNE